MIKRISIVSAVALLLAGCGQFGGGGDSEADIEAIHAVEEAQMEAVEADDVDGMVAPYASDAVLVVSGAGTFEGADAIRANFQAMADDENSALELTPGRAIVSGDLAYTTASYVYTYSQSKSGDRLVDHGTNMTVWARQDDGSWKIVADFNITVPPAGDEDENADPAEVAAAKEEEVADD